MLSAMRATPAGPPQHTMQLAHVASAYRATRAPAGASHTRGGTPSADVNVDVEVVVGPVSDADGGGNQYFSDSALVYGVDLGPNHNNHFSTLPAGSTALACPEPVLRRFQVALDGPDMRSGDSGLDVLDQEGMVDVGGSHVRFVAAQQGHLDAAAAAAAASAASPHSAQLEGQDAGTEVLRCSHCEWQTVSKKLHRLHERLHEVCVLALSLLLLLFPAACFQPTAGLQRCKND